MNESILIPTKRWNRIERILQQLEKPVLIPEAEAIALVGVEKKTFQNYVSNGTIPPTHYKVGVGGKRFYDRDLLTGLKKTA